MINKWTCFTSFNNIKRLHALICILSTFSKIQVQESMCPTFEQVYENKIVIGFFIL